MCPGLGQTEVVSWDPGVPDAPESLHGGEVVLAVRLASDTHQGAAHLLQREVGPGRGQTLRLAPGHSVVILSRPLVAEALAGIPSVGSVTVGVAVPSNHQEHPLELDTAVGLPAVRQSRYDSLQDKTRIQSRSACPPFLFEGGGTGIGRISRDAPGEDVGLAGLANISLIFTSEGREIESLLRRCIWCRDGRRTLRTARGHHCMNLIIEHT